MLICIYYLYTLNRVANRESAPQFFDHMPDYKDQYFNLRDEESNQDFLGIVLDYDERSCIATIEQRNYFKTGDEVEFIGPNIDTFSYKVKEILDENNNIIEMANKPRMIIKLRIDKKLNKNDLMKFRNFGKKSLTELDELVAVKGLTFGMDLSKYKLDKE